MKTFKFAFSAVILLLMFGCAVQFAEDNDTSHPYEGHYIKEVIELWGDPVKTYVAPNGNKVYVYYRADLKTSKDVDSNVNLHGASALQQYVTKVDVCTTYFETNADGMIVRYRYEGIGCK